MEEIIREYERFSGQFKSPAPEINSTVESLMDGIIILRETRKQLISDLLVSQEKEKQVNTAIQNLGATAKSLNANQTEIIKNVGKVDKVIEERFCQINRLLEKQKAAIKADKKAQRIVNIENVHINEYRET